MNTEIIIAIIGAVFASSGLWGLIQYLINRKDSIGEKIDKLTEMVREVSERVDANSATLARTHILRFDDELINNVQHTREYFQQILDDVDTYEKYCATHPDYKNNMCTMAIEHIRRVYGKLQDNRGF